MKRLAGFLCALAALPAWGQARGYAFDDPALFARQLAWGVVHGVRLLGRACFERGDAAAAAAYADWLDREMPVIRATERELARRYFDRDTASPDALAAVLNLRPSLETPAAELAAACATLPEALASPRYRLDRFIAEKEREGIK
ncbi:MAG: hypothetical protein OHM77_07810 [Candidatus Nitricoxidivorans perseverans]|uniref:Uncharacterized protein n=1 Tax=Candidatus Nitricoxidivorans perseverans TaxID=2975601 RepID=A0AA49FJ71_9PROT|nr:MAG: hypothetical protein OHM77_07810 [Candidatus Nitricoxidivorans perseverans]